MPDGVAQGRPNRPVGRVEVTEVGNGASAGASVGIAIGDGLTVSGPRITAGGLTAMVPLLMAKGRGTDALTPRDRRYRAHGDQHAGHGSGDAATGGEFRGQASGGCRKRRASQRGAAV